MECFPDIESFKRLYEAGKPQVVYTRLVADLETPVSAYMKLADGRADAFLFESVEGGAIRGRYSFVGMKPDLIWRCFGDKAQVNRRALIDPDAFEAHSLPTLDSLRALHKECEMDMPDSLPPMAAGLVGYMGYDCVRLVEPFPDENNDVLQVPDGIFIRPTLVAVFDSIEDIVTFVTPVRPDPEIGATAAYEKALERLSEMRDSLERPLPYATAGRSAQDAGIEPVANMTPQAYQAMVAKAKEYILAGDIFQVVLSQRFEMPFDLPPFSLYRALRRTNPSPFLFFMAFRRFAIVGSSPEILVRLRDGKVTIRPIAGTRPRGADRAEDQRMEQDLLGDPKECAEHLMLLDLGRNDVGRVSKIGTIDVTDKFIVERYSHVMHIVSNVEGQIKDGVDALTALMAGFPAGTVSGAPKVRAMQIIEELEPDRRGIYAGCIGYFGADGSMDTCIVLRTAVVKDGKMIVQAGAGIVADSDPASEHQECVNKAKALVRATQEAVRFASGRN
ncbi:MAG: anthranilate synthase component I [Rhodospirillaceae bacterium]|nr:anthranilate synthase component I [Rhodospirillaceae bacterium]MAX61347.1 anthranilate synthase component I [Rhodospirillaceae bacterium]MBB56093.1 anthranilate synthase component I [Rhodospirillaceae bacterium]|tara:strand:+ start:42197 stop:43705 length:1509 start_codon:yes stop_codon:yes gene_type:complete